MPEHKPLSAALLARMAECVRECRASDGPDAMPTVMDLWAEIDSMRMGDVGPLQSELDHLLDCGDEDAPLSKYLPAELPPALPESEVPRDAHEVQTPPVAIMPVSEHTAIVAKLRAALQPFADLANYKTTGKTFLSNDDYYNAAAALAELDGVQNEAETGVPPRGLYDATRLHRGVPTSDPVITSDRLKPTALDMPDPLVREARGLMGETLTPGNWELCRNNDNVAPFFRLYVKVGGGYAEGTFDKPILVLVKTGERCMITNCRAMLRHPAATEPGVPVTIQASGDINA